MVAFLAICLVIGTVASAPKVVAYGEGSYGAYWQVLLDVHEEFNDEYGMVQYLEYALYDMDNNGVKELIVQAGTCEADYVWRIYTIVNNVVNFIGETFGGHSMLFACPDEGFYNMMGHMGYEEICRVVYINQVVLEEPISAKELADDEDYSTPGVPIRTAYITDDSLLWDGDNEDA